MYNFFVENTAKKDGCYFITGADYNHIKNVLRMGIGQQFLVSCEGKSDLCTLEGFEGDTAIAVITEENYNNTELDAEIYLFQGLTGSSGSTGRNIRFISVGSLMPGTVSVKLYCHISVA